jgi:hypothetical protein
MPSSECLQLGIGQFHCGGSSLALGICRCYVGSLSDPGTTEHSSTDQQSRKLHLHDHLHELKSFSCLGPSPLMALGEGFLDSSTAVSRPPRSSWEPARDDAGMFFRVL